MNRALVYSVILILTVALATLQGCASQPVPFDKAAETLAKNLFTEIRLKTVLSSSKVKKIVVDDFTDEDSGEVVAASQQIEDILFGVAHDHFGNFSLSKLNSKNVVYADYVINGVISLEPQTANTREKFYHVFASATDLASGKIIAKSSAWISTRDLNYTPLREYKDAPMFLTDNRHKSKVENARGMIKTDNEDEYYDSIETSAILTEASNAYGQGKYVRSIKLYSKSADRSDGQVMKTYAGLYQANLKIGDKAAAEAAFGKLVDISVQNNSLSVKLLFAVNSTDFIGDPKLRERYQMWIRQISKFFKYNNSCANIVGHSSHTGSEAYNDQLSRERAAKVQRVMARYYAGIKNKTRVMGMGFRENIKGLGTDDGRDAIDRRVEFKIVDCAVI